MNFLVEKIACLSGADKEWLERLIDRFLTSPTKRSCDCHVVDPKKHDIIIWPSHNAKYPNDLIIQFINQKFIGMPRIDKHGNKYWKVREFYENKNDNEPEIALNAPSKIDRVAKFQARQAQAQKSETKWLTAEEHEEREARLVQERTEKDIQNQEVNHARN